MTFFFNEMVHQLKGWIFVVEASCWHLMFDKIQNVAVALHRQF